MSFDGRFGKLKQSAASFEPAHAVTRVTTILQVDVPQKNQFVATAARITAETGFVHLFVANAGVLEPKPLGFSGSKVAFIWVGFLIFTIRVSMGLIIGQRPE